MTPAPDPHAQVVALQSRLDAAELPWQASVIGQHGETTFAAAHKSSGRTCAHPSSETLFTLVAEAQERIAPKPVQVHSGVSAAINP